MASKKKTKKPIAPKSSKKNSRPRGKESIKDNGLIQDEIILVVTFVISILLFLSNFDLSGKAGEVVSSLIFGLIGVEAYILPFAIFFGTAFHLSNMGNRIAGRKLMSAIAFLIILTALLQLISTPFQQDMKFFDYYTNSSELRRGGGLIGGILVMIFCSLFDTFATYIILSAMMVISLIIMTGKAGFLYLYRKLHSYLEDRREYQKLVKEQQEEGILSENTNRPLKRSAKTFVLDPEMKNADSSGIDKAFAKKKMKDEKPVNPREEELPIVNLDHLFPENQNDTVKDTIANLAGQTAPIPTYEDELKNKFQRAETKPAAEPTDMNPGIQNPTPCEEPAVNTKAAAPENSFEKVTTTEVEQMDIDQTSNEKEHVFPPLELLARPKGKANRAGTERNLKDTAMKLQSTLESFGVHVTITNVSCGPAVTRYELQPEQGVMVSKITRLADDIKLNLAAADIRIEAPIPGKAAVGIEVPNKENSMVSLREMIESKEFIEHPSDIAFAVGKDIGGQIIVTDIAKMPHLLIAGATGSGKSVCINTLIMSILYKSKPSDVRLIMIDPKVVELNVYNGIPHLLIPVVTDPKKASAALNWAVMEMTERYKKFADAGVRDLKGYNDKVSEVADLNDENCQKLPQIIIVIDELADLMMVAPDEVEDAICRLAQLARAAGLHLVIATQRPSVNVITGLIKANIPSRIAFAVSSAIDSRTIIDGSGAEKLLGKGDMLFFPSGYPKPIRVQGAYVSDKEVSSVVDFLKQNNTEASYSEEIKEKIISNALDNGIGGSSSDRDEYFAEAGKFIIEKDKASIGMLQRVYRIGFNRAARIMDQLAEAGVVGPEEGTKPRKILMTAEEFEHYLEE